MKEIRIEATATVENREVWYAEVPDDFDINDADAVAELIYHGEADLESEEPQYTIEREITAARLT